MQRWGVWVNTGDPICCQKASKDVYQTFEVLPTVSRSDGHLDQSFGLAARVATQNSADVAAETTVTSICTVWHGSHTGIYACQPITVFSMCES